MLQDVVAQRAQCAGSLPSLINGLPRAVWNAASASACRPERESASICSSTRRSPSPPRRVVAGEPRRYARPHAPDWRGDRRVGVRVGQQDSVLPRRRPAGRLGGAAGCLRDLASRLPRFHRYVAARHAGLGGARRRCGHDRGDHCGRGVLDRGRRRAGHRLGGADERAEPERRSRRESWPTTRSRRPSARADSRSGWSTTPRCHTTSRSPKARRSSPRPRRSPALRRAPPRTWRPATYVFYCSVDAHRAAGMQGTLTVK